MACVVLHNILIRQGDGWTEEERWWTEAEKEEHDGMLQEFHSTTDGSQRRENMKRIVLNNLNLD